MNCIEWEGYRLPTGYGTFKENGKNVYAHRRAFEEANGYLPRVVRHRCDNPSCVNPEHLEGGTQADNMRDRMERGRAPKGEGHHGAKLTEDNVRYIRSMRGQTTQQALADEFGVSRPRISKIWNRKSWSHVT